MKRGHQGKIGKGVTKLSQLFKEYDYLKRGVVKNDIFYCIVILVWLSCLLRFNPRLFKLYSSLDPLHIKVTIIFLISFLNMFWFYAIYLVVLFFFSFFGKVSYVAPSSIPSPTPKVAFLYTTINDFDYKSALSCVKQDYDNFHVFLLDDSKDESYKAKVDSFHAEFAEITTVVRRKERKGFKAGAINNCVANYAKDFGYIAIADADSIFPPDFLKKIIPYFSMDDRIGYVQATHRHNPEQQGKFARDLGKGINMHWRRFIPLRNEYGFVMFFGHGGVIRRDVWEKAGGFPELVCEDLAFSCVARECGYYGFLASDVLCYEDFPNTMRQFRNRHYRWIKGTLEFVFWGLMRFLRVKRISWSEKADVVISCVALLIPVLMVFFIITNVVITLSTGYLHRDVIYIFGHPSRLWQMYLVPRFNVISGWDFYLFTCIAIFAPLLFALDLIRQPRRMLTFILQSATVYPSLLFLSTIGAATLFISGKAFFIVTGGKANYERRTEEKKGSDSIINWINKLNPEHWFVISLETTAALLLCWFCLVSYNIGLLTFGVGVILNVSTSMFGWENKFLYPLTYIPIIFVLFAFTMIGMSLINITPIFFSLMPVHM